MNNNNNKNNNKQNTNTPPPSHTAYSTEIENDTLRFWERAVLAIEAEHIYENIASISFVDFRVSSKELYTHMKQSVIQKEGTLNSTNLNAVNKKVESVYNECNILYKNMRHYLSHLEHKNIPIKENTQKIVYNCYCSALLQYEQKEHSHPLDKKDFFKNNYFTLLGLLCFLCIGLEKDRAYALCNRFAFANREKTENQDVFDAIMAIIKCYGRKKSDKVKAHPSETQDEEDKKNKKDRKEEENERVWSLMCEIIDYINKPIKGSPNYAKENYEDSQRPLSPYIVDNLIIRWITLESKIKNLEFATTGIQENKKKKSINIPVFDSKNGNYFRLGDHYWCRVRKKDTEQWIKFRMRRTHLLRIAKMILKGSEQGAIVASIVKDIEQMQSMNMNDKNLDIGNSLPRCMRDDYTPATIEKKIAYRHEQYKKVHEIDEKKYPSTQVQFILWSLQGVLKETEENDPLYPLEYQKISAMLHFYTANFVQQFREKVCNAFPEKYAYCEKYIKPSLNQTLDCIVQSVTTALEQDTPALIDKQEVVYKKHSFRFNRPQKDKHPLKKHIQMIFVILFGSQSSGGERKEMRSIRSIQKIWSWTIKITMRK